MALLSVFQRLSAVGHFDVVAAHVHHGPGPTEAWRQQALEHCKALCEQLGVSLRTAGPSHIELTSEAQLREFRYQELRKLSAEEKCDFILTAHHADDVLETRVLRLLRGTGPSGLMALSSVEGDLWRPFLGIKKRELLSYVEQNNLSFLTDPSNTSTEPLRNWIRQDLLPFIEVRQSGLVENLGRSLQLIAEAFTPNEGLPLSLIGDAEVGFARADYLGLAVSEQKRGLAQVLLQLGVKNYSHGQIEEIHKRLDKPQKGHTFTLGSVLWTVDAKQVRARAEMLSL